MSTQTRASMPAKCSTALLGVLLAGCGIPGPSGETRPLVDDHHAPDILTESRVVEPPPSLGGNRFLKGWFPWRHEDIQVLVPNQEGAVLQIVNISSRPRSLVLNTRMLGDGGEFEVTVEVANIPLPSVPLGESVVVPLPANLPLGRISIRLGFPKTPDPVVLTANLEQALPPGKVEIGPQTIVQAPSSLVDFARPTAAGARLVGRFDPPSKPRPDQRFAIIVEQESQAPQVLFEWHAGWMDRWRGERSFSLPLPGDSDFIRIRLQAEGSGSAAAWHELRIALPESDVEDPSSKEPPAILPSPPRLVVLYVLDALRADHVDLDGTPDGPTPTLSRLAGEGVVFDRHMSVAPNTIPSTKSLFTGQVYYTRGNAKLATNGPETLAEVFAGAGYRTGAFSGNEFISDAYGTSRGFQHLANEVVFRDYADVAGAYNRNAERVQRSALDWLDTLDEADSAFLYLHTIHPHNPYDPPDELAQRFVGDVDSKITATSRNLLDIKHNRLEVTEADQRRITGLYAAALAYNDEQIALLIDELTQRYPKEEILLIVTSDHGEELFDHGGVLHGYTLYREQLQIPLILWWPERLEPQRIDLGTDNLDLHESLRSLVGASSSVAKSGRSFWDLIGIRAPRHPIHQLRFAAASSVQGGIFMTQSERFKLILAPRVGMNFGMGEGRGRGRDPEYLFDLQNDPQELINLAGAMSPEIDWMRSRLTAWIGRGRSLETDEVEPVLDEEAQSRLRALGYLE